jgi:hypothetical protein
MEEVIWHVLEPIVMWAYNTSVSQWVRASTWAVAIFEVLHLFGLILLLGSVLMIGLRSFGIALHQDGVGQVVRGWSPTLFGGLALMTISGSLIFSSGVTRYVDSRSFQVKMSLYVIALIVQGAIYAIACLKKDEDRRPGQTWTLIWMVLAGLAALLWFGVGIAGRGIAFI